MRHNQQGKGWWVMTYWQETRPSYKMRDVCQQTVSQSLEAERDRLGVRLGLTSPAWRLGSKLRVVVMLGTGLCQGQSRLCIDLISDIKDDYFVFWVVLCVNYFIVIDPYLPPVVCFWGKVSSTTVPSDQFVSFITSCELWRDRIFSIYGHAP